MQKIKQPMIYKIKFYPKFNAFSLSPSPKHGHKTNRDSGLKEFYWSFSAGDCLELDWDEDGHTGGEYILQFRWESDAARALPFPFKIKDENANDVREEMPLGMIAAAGQDVRAFSIRKNMHLEFVGGDKSEYWGFDFIHRDNGRVITCIDPEIKIRGGR